MSPMLKKKKKGKRYRHFSYEDKSKFCHNLAAREKVSSKPIQRITFGRDISWEKRMTRIIVRLARKRGYCLIVSKVGAWTLEMGLGKIWFILTISVNERVNIWHRIAVLLVLHPQLALGSFPSDGQPCTGLVGKYFE